MRLLLCLLLAVLTMLEPGVFEIKILCPPERESEYRETLTRAQRNLFAFAQRYGWQQCMETPLVNTARFFTTKQEYDQYLYELFPEQAGKPIPATFTAGTQNDELFAVSPEVLARNVPSADPEAYEKLLQHELAHVLHIRICGGDESKMGPIWFWEGFAVTAADQYPDDDTSLTESQIWDIVGAQKRGSYRKYRVVFRHFHQKTTMPEFMTHSQQPDFEQWLHTLK